MDLGLQGKKALVTGSTGGIGFAIAKMLAQEGATVYVNGRTEERVKDALKQIHSDNAKAAVGDLAHAEGVSTLLRMLPEVDILINNLGIYEVKAFDQITDEDWMRIFEVNVLSGIRLSRAYFSSMKAKNWGRIVFISSESGVNIPSEMIHYGVTKTAQLAVARGLSELTAGTAVTVNSVLPGPTFSEGVKDFISDMAKSQNKTMEQIEREFFLNVRPSSLIKRFATADEVAALVAFVCSVQAAAINGAALRVEGGVVRSIT